MSRGTPYLLASPAAALLVGLMLGPLVLLARVSLYEPPAGRGYYAPGTWTTANYAAATDADGLTLLAFTAGFAGTVAAAAVAVGFPLALFIRSLGPTGRRAAVGVVLLPKLASALVVMFGLQQLLSAAGPVGRGLALAGYPGGVTKTLVAAVIGEVYLVLPYAVLILLIQLGRIDPALQAAARGLGAGRWQAFRRVTLPLAAPGLVLAGHVGLMWGAGAFLGPMLLANPADETLAVAVYRQASPPRNDWPGAAASAVLLTLTAGGLVAAFGVVSRLVRGRR